MMSHNLDNSAKVIISSREEGKEHLAQQTTQYQRNMTTSHVHIVYVNSVGLATLLVK